MPIQVPEEARCLKCGYLLRQLDEPVCPECARRFDPGDPTTYNADPRKRRRRRIVRWIVILLLVAGVAFALWPRQVMRATITFTFPNSGRTVTVRRWELQPPRWIPFRYPGFNRRSQTTGSQAARSDEPYTYSINADFGMGSLSASGSKDDDVTINGVVADPDHAGEIIKTLLHPDNNGIFFAPRQTESPTEPEEE